MTTALRLLPFAAIALALGFAQPARADTIVDNWSKVEAPAAPKLADVTVDPKTTALLMLDFLKQNCTGTPSCMASLPVVQPLLANARAKKMMVVHSKFPIPGNVPAETLAQVAPVGKEPVVTGFLDKFLGTNLDKMLKARHIKTVIVVGSASNGAVLFTAASAFFHQYDVIVPVDGMSSRAPYADQSTVYDLASAPVMGGKIKLTTVSGVKF